MWPQLPFGVQWASILRPAVDGSAIRINYRIVRSCWLVDFLGHETPTACTKRSILGGQKAFSTVILTALIYLLSDNYPFPKLSPILGAA